MITTLRGVGARDTSILDHPRTLDSGMFDVSLIVACSFHLVPLMRPSLADITPTPIRTWQLWTTLAASAFVLHFAWEMAQMPLYANMQGLSTNRVLATCGQATFGDVMITLVAYGSVAWAARSVRWARGPNGKQVLAYLGIGLVITVVLEAANVYELQRWTYAPAMPRLFRIGIAPIVQWTVIPLVVLLAIRVADRMAYRGRETAASTAEM